MIYIIVMRKTIQHTEVLKRYKAEYQENYQGWVVVDTNSNKAIFGTQAKPPLNKFVVERVTYLLNHNISCPLDKPKTI
jgi:hypothetical protein